jgi:hypothetical protein
MLKKTRNFLVAVNTIVILGLSACNGGKTTPTAVIPTSSPTNTSESITLATPYAQQPAAGICASFESELVVITIYPDIPDPRCSKVRPDQKLKVINQTQNTLQIIIGKFQASLEPGAEVIFDTPFGDYLAVGVHQLQVSPCCSPELMLEANP